MTAKKKKPAQTAQQLPGKPSGDDAAPDAPVFPIIGIGASAGGLEALEAFIENLPADSGMAIVVITHTDPKRVSLLPDIIGRRTKIAVKEIEKGMAAEPNTVYIAPSDRDPVFEKRTFDLKQRPARDALHMPVDLFLKRLALERGTRAGCVILSGTGTDGTHGLRSIKEHAGLAVVQDPATTRHAGMPDSAIDTGLVDFVMAPAEMPERLIDYFNHPVVSMDPAPAKAPQKMPDSLDRIIALLAKRTRNDFSLYKTSTVKRRIAVTGSRDAATYIKRLYDDRREVQTLFQDMLIGVTGFFRDPEAFAFLKATVLPARIPPGSRGSTLRVWVPGCATGEEAYSVAILINEYMQEQEVLRDLQIFGTDVDPRAIRKARGGVYLPNIAAEVDAERIERFFVKQDGGYRVKRDIRETVVFAEQNLLRDPPFSNLDLLVCRNLLIYLTPAAQDRLIPLFHHTLNPDGILFLGNSETIGRFSNLFKPLSRSHSIFGKQNPTVRPQFSFPTGKIEPAVPGDREEGGQPSSAKPSAGLDKAVEQVLLQEFTPACVVLNPSGEIAYTHGRTGRYLELAPGRPNLNLSDMAREDLRFALIAALRKARETGRPVREKGLRAGRTNGEYRWIDLTVKRFKRPPIKDALLVVFEERPAPAEKIEPADAAGGGEAAQDRIVALEQELLRLRQEYHATREELETANEELRSANEEMQSSNEELQSTNEELESSREELQSLNEEINTVNDELHNKIGELHDSYEAVTGTLNGTRIAMVFLDNDLRVTRFTTEATRLIHLIESDIGRPIRHISNTFDGDYLPDRAAQVLDRLTPFEDEVRTEAGNRYRLNIMVNRKGNQTIDGVVMTFINIDAQKNPAEDRGSDHRPLTRDP